MRNLPIGIVALVGLFLVGAVAGLLTCIALLFPGGTLDVIWRLNPQAHDVFLTIGPWAVGLMLVVGLACAFSAAGLLTRSVSGHRLAVAMLAANLVGDTLNAFVRGDWWTLTGLPIGGALIAYLYRPQIRGLYTK